MEKNYRLIFLFAALLTSSVSLAQYELVIDIYPGTNNGIDPQSYQKQIFKSFLYFTAKNTAASGRLELWRTDGTTLGSSKVSSNMNFASVGDNSLQASSSFLYFFEFTGSNTAATLVALDENLNRIELSTVNSNNTAFAVLNNGKVIFEKNYQLWVFNEVTRSSSQLSAVFYPFRFTIKNNITYFTGRNLNSGKNQTGKTDGTLAGTAFFIDEVANDLATAGTKGYLSVYLSTVSAYHLYETDGTQVGTKILSGFYGDFRYLTDVNGTLFFIGRQSGSTTLGWELYKVQGSSVVIVKDIYPGSSDGLSSGLWGNKPSVVNGIVYFSAEDGNVPYATDLWRSDGTAAGTYRVRGVATTPSSKYPGFITAVNNSLYFPVGVNFSDGFWISDGTAAGTNQISGIQGQGIFTMEYFNGYLYYPARTAVTGIELFRYAAPGATLPLTLTSFKGTLIEKAVYLNWTSVNEQNVKEFIIERGGDMHSFIAIGTVNATNLNAARYKFTDYKPIPGISYYRLNIVDKDGSNTYSEVVAINNRSNAAIQVFPNPSFNTINVTHSRDVKSTFINIYNSIGQQVKSFIIKAGTYQTTMHINELIPGNYVMIFNNNTERQKITFIKK